MTVELFPEIEPYNQFMFDVGDGHQIYVEECGNPDGEPITFLHGGPGSGCNSWHRRLFDPEKFRIILFDQRGSGRSLPNVSFFPALGLQDNTTQHLIDDMEKIRDHLDIGRWHITGGSWGSTLALVYADQHSKRVKSMIIYGIFLSRDEELEALYFDGGMASKIFPDVFYPYLNILPDADKENPLIGYDKLFRSDDKEVREKAVDLWTRLEKRVSRLIVPQASLDEEMSDPDFVLAHSLVENHYFLSNSFIDGNAILKRAGQALRDIPMDIIQGRYDMVTPFKTAWELHNQVPHSNLHIIDNAGHSAKEKATTKKLLTLISNIPVSSLRKINTETKAS